MYNKSSPSLHKGNKKGCVLSNSQLDDVRDLIEELDLIPLGCIPPGLYPHIKEYQEQLVKDAIPFDPISDLVVKPLAERLRERKKIRVAQQQEELFELCV